MIKPQTTPTQHHQFYTRDVITYISNAPIANSIRCSTPVWHQPPSR